MLLYTCCSRSPSAPFFILPTPTALYNSGDPLQEALPNPTSCPMSLLIFLYYPVCASLIHSTMITSVLSELPELCESKNGALWKFIVFMPATGPYTKGELKYLSN